MRNAGNGGEGLQRVSNFGFSKTDLFCRFSVHRRYCTWSKCCSEVQNGGLQLQSWFPIPRLLVVVESSGFEVRFSVYALEHESSFSHVSSLILYSAVAQVT